jgi:hypothetical protein
VGIIFDEPNMDHASRCTHFHRPNGWQISHLDFGHFYFYFLVLFIIHSLFLVNLAFCRRTKTNSY